MQKSVRMFAVLGMIAGLCVGCGNADKPEPEETEQPKASSTNNWEPETAEMPEGHSADDGHDHSGHNH